MGDVEGWGAVGDGVGGEGVGVYGGWGFDTGVCSGVFRVGFWDLCEKRGYFWVGDVGACGFGVGGFWIGFCELFLHLLFNLSPVLEPRGKFQIAEDDCWSDYG